MTLATLFWVIYIIALIFGAWGFYDTGQPFPFRRWASGSLIYWILPGILGWAVFGGIVHRG